MKGTGRNKYFGGSAERGLHKDVEMSFLGGLEGRPPTSHL